MSKKRVHILTAVNAGAVSKAGGTYTIRDVCGAVDDIVMHRMLYPGDELARGAASLNNKPAPAGHPRNSDGAYISALNADALLNFYAGAVCRNARHEGGRTLVDIVVNEAQAKAHPDGAKLVERLDAAITGANSDPIHVSTGLICHPITANGESRGKKYDQIATAIDYDHLAILLNERGAGTPADGVGMWLNAEGKPQAVEVVELDTAPHDRRAEGLRGWLSKLLGNSGSDVSFDAIQSGLHSGLPEGAWLREVFQRYAVWTDRDGKLWKQDYAVSSDGSVAWSGTAEEVRLRREYEPITNHEDDAMRESILAALNKAGVSVAGKTDDQLLADYDALQTAPLQSQLTAANSKVAEFEANAQAAAKAELTAIAGELAANSQHLKAADFEAMGLARCKELKAAAAGTGAAPIAVGNAGGQSADPYANYPDNPGYEPKEAK